MCKSADALRKLTLPDGSSRYSGTNSRPDDAKTWLDGGCIDIQPDAQVTVQVAHKNTSAVTYFASEEQGPQTYIIPNIDFTATPSKIPMPRGGCVKDSAAITLSGTLREIHSRDKRSGEPYSYFLLHTERPVCLAGEDIDDSNTTPRQDITVIDQESQRADFRRRLGPCTISGKLESSNGGGPQLFNPVFH
jgi:hypothetical protein